MNRRQLVTPPAALRRADAAAHLGISPTHFDRLVREGFMPPARDLRGVKVWVRAELEDALTAGAEMEANTCDSLFPRSA